MLDNIQTAANETNRKQIYTDLLWYVLGSLVPMFILFVKSPIFTRLYTPEEYGYYSIAVSSYKYLGAVLFAWLASCMWRFYHRYDREGRLAVLYSNISLILFVSSSATILLSVAAAAYVNSAVLSTLFIYCALQIMLEQAIGLLFIVIRLNGKAMLYNVLQATRVIAGFVVLCVLAFGYGVRIESLVQSIVIVDVLFVVLATVCLHAKKVQVFLFSLVAWEDIKLLMRYGSVSIVTSLGLFVLISSDRYIIAWYSDMGNVGIYNQIYNLGQITVSALIAVFFNVINPEIMKGLEYQGDSYNDVLSSYMLHFVRLFLPLVVLLSFFSQSMTELLLGESFWSGHTILPFILFSFFFYGLTQFSEFNLQFNNKFKILITGITVPAVLNITANIIGIPIWGYQFAALSTIVAYMLMFLFFTFRSGLSVFSNKAIWHAVGKIILLILCAILADFALRTYLCDFGWIATVAEGAVLYAIILATLYPDYLKRLWMKKLPLS